MTSTQFLVAFSCKGRGVCPSCTTKRMVATAAHLVDAVISRVPMRQWVLSLPKRLRPALRADPGLVTRALRSFIDNIERSLRACCVAPDGARLGAVSFLQRFGSALNDHWHYHCCVSDGVFHEDVNHALVFVSAKIDAATVADVQAHVRRRVLAAYRRRGWLDAEAAADMARWDHGGGFSVDVSVAIQANDRPALERLLRYCARPYRASVRLVPPSVPSSPKDLAEVIRRELGRPAHAIQPLPDPVTAAPPGARSWARLIARIYAVDPLRCRRCGGTLRLVAFIIEHALIVRILDYVGEPSRAPRMVPIRAPPFDGERWDGNDASDCAAHALDSQVDVMPDYENQRQDLSW